MAVQDVILTITVMLGAGLACRLVADLLQLPHMVVLLGAAVLLGPAVADAIDVPLDSMGAQLVLTLGVSFILFHGGLQLSGRVLGQVAVGVGLLHGRPGSSRPRSPESSSAWAFPTRSWS